MFTLSSMIHELGKEQWAILWLRGKGGSESDAYYDIEFGSLLSQGVYHLFVILTEMTIFSKMKINWGQNLGEILVGLRGKQLQFGNIQQFSA